MHLLDYFEIFLEDCLPEQEGTLRRDQIVEVWLHSKREAWGVLLNYR